jgi:eukaryotic-like serine/threonine-protein kinase
MGLFNTLFRIGPPRTDVKQRFELIGATGQGSMSKVWRARDRESGRIVALKILDRDQTTKFEARFPGMNKPSEGVIATSLRHPNIVETYEHGLTKDGLPFLVMEFIEGYGLTYYIGAQNDVFKKNRLRFMIELGEAITHVHEKNYIHRDLCPRNVIITEDLHVKLFDFGLVVPNKPEFRRPGNRTGTANYMAPELIRRHSTDQRIDVFSYAVTCFEMCTGRLPWDSAKTLEAIVQHLNNPPLDIRDVTPEIDEEIAAVITRGLQVDPARRWQTAREMTEAFREVPIPLDSRST